MIGISRSRHWQKKKELFQNRVAVLTIQSYVLNQYPTTSLQFIFGTHELK